MNILPIIKKEFYQIQRDKRMLGVLLFIPGLMLFMFGYALNFDVKHTRLAIYDNDRSPLSRAFIEKFSTSEYFDVVETLTHPSEIDERLDAEKVRAVIVMPANFSDCIAKNRETSVQIIVDGSNSNAASIVLGYINAVIQQYSFSVISQTLQRSGKKGVTIPIQFEPRIWFNPELKSAKFMVPGLIAFILMVTAVISTTLSVVREKEHGTMEQLMVAPLAPTELILGKTIPYILISIVATTIILLLGYILFDVTIKGNVFLLAIVSIVYLIGALGLGLFISTIANTQQVAFMIAALTTLLPTFILSGFVFPIRNMPLFIQAVTYIVPARYFLVALRSIILKGVGIQAFLPELLALIVFMTITVGLSILRLRKALR